MLASWTSRANMRTVSRRVVLALPGQEAGGGSWPPAWPAAPLAAGEPLGDLRPALPGEWRRLCCGRRGAIGSLALGSVDWDWEADESLSCGNRPARPSGVGRPVTSRRHSAPRGPGASSEEPEEAEGAGGLRGRRPGLWGASRGQEGGSMAGQRALLQAACGRWTSLWAGGPACGRVDQPVGRWTCLGRGRTCLGKGWTSLDVCVLRGM